MQAGRSEARKRTNRRMFLDGIGILFLSMCPSVSPYALQYVLTQVFVIEVELLHVQVSLRQEGFYTGDEILVFVNARHDKRMNSGILHYRKFLDRKGRE